MARPRTYTRDRRGRFASTGTSGAARTSHRKPGSGGRRARAKVAAQGAGVATLVLASGLASSSKHPGVKVAGIAGGVAAAALQRRLVNGPKRKRKKKRKSAAAGR